MAKKYRELGWGKIASERTLPLPVPTPPSICRCPNMTLTAETNSVIININVDLIDNINTNTRYKLQYRNTEFEDDNTSGVTIGNPSPQENLFLTHTEFTFADFDSNGYLSPITIGDLPDTTAYEFKIVTICTNDDNTETVLASDECGSKFVTTELSECNDLENPTSELIDYNLVTLPEGYFIDVLNITPDSWYGVDKLRVYLESKPSNSSNYTSALADPGYVVVDVSERQSERLTINPFEEYSFDYNTVIRIGIQSDCFGDLNSGVVYKEIGDIDPPGDVIDPVTGPFNITQMELITDCDNSNPNTVQFQGNISPYLPTVYTYTYIINALSENGDILNSPSERRWSSANSTFDISNLSDIKTIFEYQISIFAVAINGEEYTNTITVQNTCYDNSVEICPEYEFLPLEETLLETGLDAGLYEIKIKWKQTEIELEENQSFARTSFFRLDYIIDGDETNIELDPTLEEYVIKTTLGASISFSISYICDLNGSNIKTINYGNYETPGDASCPELILELVNLPEPEEVFVSSEKYMELEIKIHGINTGLYNQLELNIYHGSSLLGQPINLYPLLDLGQTSYSYIFNDFNPRDNYTFEVQALRFTTLEPSGIECDVISERYRGVGEETCDIEIEITNTEVNSNSITVDWESTIPEYNDFYGYVIDISPRPSDMYPLIIRNPETKSHTYEDLDFNEVYKIIVYSTCASTLDGALVLDPLNGDIEPGNNSNPDIVEVGTDDEPMCMGPENVMAEGVGNTSINVTWNINPESIPLKEIGVQFRIVGNNNWNTKKVTPLDSTSYLLENLNPGRAYQVRVYFICTNGDIIESPPTTTNTEMPPCENTTLRIRDIRQGEIDLGWDVIPNVSPNQTSGYIIKWKRDDESEYTNEKEIDDPNRTATTITGLEVGVDYKFNIMVTCNNTTSPSNNDDVDVFIDECAKPSSIEITNINNSNGEVTLEWTNVTNSNEYTFGYKEVNSQTWNDSNVNTNQITLVLSNNTTYDFRVKSLCDSGESDWAYLNRVLVTIIDCKLPPHTVEANGPNSIKVNINENQSNADFVINYELKYRKVGDTQFQTTPTFSSNAYIIENLMENTAYEISLIKYCGDDEMVEYPNTKTVFTEDKEEAFLCENIDALPSLIKEDFRKLVDYMEINGNRDKPMVSIYPTEFSNVTNFFTNDVFGVGLDIDITNNKVHVTWDRNTDPSYNFYFNAGLFRIYYLKSGEVKNIISPSDPNMDKAYVNGDSKYELIIDANHEMWDNTIIGWTIQYGYYCDENTDVLDRTYFGRSTANTNAMIAFCGTPQAKEAAREELFHSSQFTQGETYLNNITVNNCDFDSSDDTPCQQGVNEDTLKFVFTGPTTAEVSYTLNSNIPEIEFIALRFKPHGESQYIFTNYLSFNITNEFKSHKLRNLDSGAPEYMYHFLVEYADGSRCKTKNHIAKRSDNNNDTTCHVTEQEVKDAIDLRFDIMYSNHAIVINRSVFDKIQSYNFRLYDPITNVVYVEEDNITTNRYGFDLSNLSEPVTITLAEFEIICNDRVKFTITKPFSDCLHIGDIFIPYFAGFNIVHNNNPTNPAFDLVVEKNRSSLFTTQSENDFFQFITNHIDSITLEGDISGSNVNISLTPTSVVSNRQIIFKNISLGGMATRNSGTQLKFLGGDIKFNTKYEDFDCVNTLIIEVNEQI